MCSSTKEFCSSRNSLRDFAETTEKSGLNREMAKKKGSSPSPATRDVPRGASRVHATALLAVSKTSTKN